MMSIKAFLYAPHIITITAWLLLSACQSQPARPLPKTSSDTQALFAQPYIDPLTDYLEQHPNASQDLQARIHAEREKRCAEVAVLYQQRDKTTAQLNKLRTAYQRSCPHLIEAFARQLPPATPQAPPQTMATSAATAASEMAIDSPSYAAYRQQALQSCLQALSDTAWLTVIKPCKDLAKHRDAMAQTYLGRVYFQHQQPQQAAHWWQQAAAQGMAQAQYHLGLLYAKGQGVSQNVSQAAQWLQRAAHQGHSAAQYHLGLLYARGQGVKQDNIEALAWWLWAGQQGFEPAQAQQTTLREQLTPLQWQSAKQRMRHLQQTYTGNE